MLLDINQLKEKIVGSGKISEEELETKIQQKMDELAGLISREGAAHIIANELGVQVMPTEVAVKIKSLSAGMRNVEVLGKVLKVYDVRNFQTAKGNGKVGSLLVGDETGNLRIVFWNDQADKITTIKETDILKVKNGYIKNNNGINELHLNDRSQIIINPEGEKVEAREKAGRKALKELSEADQNAEILVTLVEIFDMRFFSVCPQCNKRVLDTTCTVHGTVQPAVSYVLNVVGDDGTDTMRVTLWKSQAERILGMDEKQILNFKDYPEQFQDVKHKLLGEMVKFVGRVSKNTMFNRLEFNANLVFIANAEEELKRLSDAA